MRSMRVALCAFLVIWNLPVFTAITEVSPSILWLLHWLAEKGTPPKGHIQQNLHQATLDFLGNTRIAPSPPHLPPLPPPEKEPI